MKKKASKILIYTGAVLLVLWLIGTTAETPSAERLPHFMQSLGFAGTLVALVMIGLLLWPRKRAEAPVQTDDE